MTKNEKLSLLITPEKFIEERPAMISFDNNEIQECIFTAFNVINAQCANLPQEVWNYMHVTKLDPPQVVDVNNNLYRNEYEIDQFFQAIVAQTHYNLTMGNDFSQGSTSFSSGGINAAIQRPEKRDILAPSVVLFLQNARLYNIQQYGISKSSNEGGSCSIWDKFITREIGDDRYIQKMQENANVGSIAYVNENKMVSFKDPNEITFKDYFADKIKDVDGDYKPIQDIENLAFFGNDGNDAATRNFVTQARNSWTWDYLYTYSKGNMVMTYDEITKLFTYYLSNFNNNLNHDPTLDTQQFWWTKIARDDGIIAQQIAKLDERIKANTANIATNTQNITTTNSKVALNTTAIENLTNTLNSKRFLDFVGEYNDATTYTIAQVVSFENELWICKVNSVVGVSPKQGANNQWELLSHVDIDLSNYYTKIETQWFLQTLNTKIDNEVANVVKTTDPIVNLQGNLTTPNIEANTTNFQSSSATNLDVTTQATFQKTIDENDNVKTITNKEYVDRRISEMLAGSATDATKLAEFFNNMYPIGSVVYTSSKTSDVPPVHKLVQLYPDCFEEIEQDGGWYTRDEPCFLALHSTKGGYFGSNTRTINRSHLPNLDFTHRHTSGVPVWREGGRTNFFGVASQNTSKQLSLLDGASRTSSDSAVTSDTTLKLNGGVSQQSMDITPKRIIVRMWKVIRTIFTPENVKQMIAGFTEQDITQLAIDAFTQSIVPIQNQIDGTNANVESLGNEVQALDNRVGQFNDEISNNANSITNLENRVNNLNQLLENQQLENVLNNAALKNVENTFTQKQTINKTDWNDPHAISIEYPNNKSGHIVFKEGTSVVAHMGRESNNSTQFIISGGDRELKLRGGNNNLHINRSGLLARMDVEFGTRIKMGHGGGLIKFTPEDNTTKTLQFFENNPTDSKRLMLKVATPTEANHVTNKEYVDAKFNESNTTITNLQTRVEEVNTTLTTNIQQNTTNIALKANQTELDNYVKKSNTTNLTIENTQNTIIRSRILNLTSTTGDLQIRVPDNKGIDVGNKPIFNVPNPRNNTEATNKQYVDSKANSILNGSSSFGSVIKAGQGAGFLKLSPEDNSRKTILFANTSIGANNRFDLDLENKSYIKNVPTPQRDSDIVSKSYVDNKINEHIKTLEINFTDLTSVEGYNANNIRFQNYRYQLNIDHSRIIGIVPIISGGTNSQLIINAPKVYENNNLEVPSLCFGTTQTYTIQGKIKISYI